MLTLSIDRNSTINNGAYVFSSQPRVVQQRNKCREHRTADFTRHLVYSNYCNRNLAKGNALTNSRNNESACQSLYDTKKSFSGNKKLTSSSNKALKRNAWISNTPEPVEGRQHVQLQTEIYLEELGGVIEEMEVSCQTDPFLDRPPSPLFIPAKLGMDQGTQIYENDLFDFDLEVRPILEVLIGKVTEQALIEVMEEEELASLRHSQRIFEELRNAELQEQQSLEEAERRKKEEKLKRMKQEEEKMRQDKETAEKISAKIYAQQFLTDLIPSVFATLSQNGFFYDPVERDIETNFFPKLLRNVRKNLHTNMTSRRLLDGLIREALIRKMKIARNFQKKPQEDHGTIAEENEKNDNNDDDDDRLTPQGDPPPEGAIDEDEKFVENNDTDLEEDI